MHIDLNLLQALNALLEEGSVMAAAERLHLSQPAMSRTLGRIRDATGDPILVRSGRRMTPTPFAEGVREQVRLLLQQATGVLTPKRALDLRSLKRTFAIRCNDAVAIAFGGRLITALHTEAPHVRLRMLPEHSGDTQELRQGQLDLEIGSGFPATAELRQQTVYADHLAVAVRARHPWTKGTLTAERFAQGQHVIVSRRGRLRDPIDTALETLGLRRQVLAAFPGTAAAMAMVHSSDTAVVIPQDICRASAAALRLAILPLPFEVSPMPLVVTWHQRQENDSAHRWLRHITRTIISGICERKVN